MRSKTLKTVTLLLLACLSGAAKAENAEAEAAVVRGAVVYIPEEQKEAIQIELPMGYPYPLASSALYEPVCRAGKKESRISDISPDILSSSSDLFRILTTTLIGIAINHTDCYRKGKDMPPAGSPSSAPYFKEINKKIKSGELRETISSAIKIPFQGETWLERVEISSLTQKIDQNVLQVLLQKRHKQGTLPGTAIVVRNYAVFGQDFYKLWLLTDVRIYKAQAQGMSRNAEVRTKTEHYSVFASFHDLRDSFEIREPEKESDREKFIIGFWTREGGKPYFDAVSQLASKNAGMIKRIMLDQPPAPFNAAEGVEPTSIITLYKIEPEIEIPQKRTRMRYGNNEKPETPEEKEERLAKKQRKERIEDGRAMHKMNPVRRKIYMLGKEYEYAFLADIIESTPERIIALDSDFKVFYSLPRNKLGLLTAANVDPQEYTEIVREWQRKNKLYVKKGKTKKSSAAEAGRDATPSSEGVDHGQPDGGLELTDPEDSGQEENPLEGAEE